MRTDRGWQLPQSAGAEAWLPVLLCFHAIKNTYIVSQKNEEKNVALTYPKGEKM